MKRWLYYLLAALIVVLLLLVTLGVVHPGYVLIYVGGYSFETTLVALAFVVALLVLLLKAVLWTVRILRPGNWGKARLWSRFFGPKDPVQATTEGVQALLLGSWQDAYRLLVENAPNVQVPAFNYLAASLAAYQRDDKNGWSFCLDQVVQLQPELAEGVQSVRAWLLAQTGDNTNAMRLLHDVQKRKPNQPFILQQMATLYRTVGDWSSLEQMLPDLERRHALGGLALQKLQDEIYPHQLHTVAQYGEASLKRYWNQVPKALRSHALITAAYVRELGRVGNPSEALALGEAFLKKQLSDEVSAEVRQLKGYSR